MAGPQDPGGFWPAVPSVPEAAPAPEPKVMDVRPPLPKIESQLVRWNVSYPRAIRRGIVEMIEPTGLWANASDIHRDMGRWAHSLGYSLFDINVAALSKEQRRDHNVTGVSLTPVMWNLLDKLAEFHNVGRPTAFFGVLCAYLSLQAERLGVTWSKESEWLATVQWFMPDSRRVSRPPQRL